jgi:hypothetical protein
VLKLKFLKFVFTDSKEFNFVFILSYEILTSGCFILFIDPKEAIELTLLWFLLLEFFKSFDKNGNKKIDPEEFSWGLKNFDIFLSDEESKAVIEAFDTNRDGTVSIDEFITAIRGDLNSYRLSFVKKAF